MLEGVLKVNFFSNLKVSLKLGILVCVAAFFVGIVGYTGYHYLLKANEDMTDMYQNRLLSIKWLNENRSQIRGVQANLLEMMMTTDDKRHIELKADLDKRAALFNENLNKYEQTKLDEREVSALTKVKDTLQAYRQAREDVIRLAMQNKNAEAYTMYEQRVKKTLNEANKELVALTEYNAQKADELNKANDAEFAAVKKMILGIQATALVLLALIGFYISKLIIKPINVMLAFSRELANGDFRKKPRTFASKDEFGQLADALIEVRSTIRELMNQIHVSAEQVAASSEQLTASADQSAQAANQVAITITEVAKGAEEQLASVEETSQVVEQMSGDIQQIAANSLQVSRQSLQAADKAKVGNLSVEKAVSQMSQIEQTVTKSADVVAKLGERSREIGQIVDTISGIAAQTNLLALNAAIEAARAGEQGRGFAVVADEVRTLAEQSQEAAKKIAMLINEIQGDTEEAVRAMSDGTKEVKIGAEVVADSGTAFREITELVGQVSNAVGDISKAIEQVASGSERIVRSVETIDELSEKASGEAQTVSAATEEQSASMEEIASSSQELAKLAMELREAVGKFQV